MTLPVWQRNVVDDAGDVVAGAEITIRDEATGLFPADGVFSDRAGTVPLTDGSVFADDDGFIQFFSAPAEIRVTAAGAPGGATWRYIPLIANSIMGVPTDVIVFNDGNFAKQGNVVLAFGSGTGGFSTGTAIVITEATYREYGDDVHCTAKFTVTGATTITIGDVLAFTAGSLPFAPDANIGSGVVAGVGAIQASIVAGTVAGFELGISGGGQLTAFCVSNSGVNDPSSSPMSINFWYRKA